MTENRKSQPEEQAIPEQLSPELVLVDPQLADLARERLPSERLAGARTAPKSHDDLPGAPSAVEEGEVELNAVSPDYAEDDQPLARAGPRRRRVFGTAVGVFAVAAAAFPIVAHELTDVGGSASKRIPTRSESLPAQRAADARQKRRTSEAPRAAASPHVTKPAVKPNKRAQPVQPSELLTRVFIWPPVSRATFYKVEFFRRGRRVFEASPAMPRIELPLRWVFGGRHFRLTRRTYRWEVRPAFGPRSHPRYGNLITQSTWIPQ